MKFKRGEMNKDPKKEISLIWDKIALTYKQNCQNTQGVFMIFGKLFPCRETRLYQITGTTIDIIHLLD